MARLVIRVDMTKGKAALKKRAVAVAKREHAKIMSTSPAPISFTRFVDGARDTPEEAVRDGGNIIYQYNRLDRVVEFALETLADLSPRLTGAYAANHVLFINGVPATDMSSYRPGDDLAISNLAPYARKIEVGKMKMRVPGTDQVFRRARDVIMQRFGNHANVEFTYRAVITGRQVDQAKAASSGQPWWLGGAAARKATGDFERTLGPTQHNQRSVRFPTLVFKPAGTGRPARGRRR
jgi:hypothetical protein